MIDTRSKSNCSANRCMKIEQSVASFISESKEAYSVFSFTDKVVYCNDLFEDLFCYSCVQAIGKTFSELILNAYKRKQGISFC